MDMKEWIIIGGGALIGLIVLHGLFMAWWRSRDPLRMKIQPGLLPEDLDGDDWLSAELPNGGARVVSVEELAADPLDADDADDGIPLLLEPAGVDDADEVDLASDMDLAAEAEASAEPGGDSLSDLAPIVPERRLRSVGENVHVPSIWTEPDREMTASELDVVDLEADESPLDETLDDLEEMEIEVMPETAPQVPESVATFEDAGQGAKAEADSPSETAADDMLVIHLLAPPGQAFGGEELVGALRAQELRFGEMDIFHRIDALTGEAVFSVVRAVEPGSFDLTRVADCASPGVIAFLRLPSHGDATAAVEDLIHTAEAMSDELGGELLDENRQPFTALSAEGYRTRALGFTDRQLLRGVR